MSDKETLLAEVRARERVVVAYLLARRTSGVFEPEHLRDGVFSYVERPAKRLRPAVLLFSCGAAGGDETLAVPAAAGVEMVHTWTLTHDDLIDHDEKRRGGATVHVDASERARRELGYSSEDGVDYGRRMAILVGDAQHAWSVALFLETPTTFVRAEVLVRLVHLLESRTIPALLQGETLDVQFERREVLELDEPTIVEMLRLKTGVLYRFAATAGAMLGRNVADPSDPLVEALAGFAESCGIAFQLQDDILGIVGDEEALGKPVGSDIREGKRTTIVLHALRHASAPQRHLLERVLGNRDATPEEVDEVRRLMAQLGSLEHTARLARSHVERAQPHLGRIPPSRYRDLLQAWASYMVEREF